MVLWGTRSKPYLAPGARSCVFITYRCPFPRAFWFKQHDNKQVNWVSWLVTRLTTRCINYLVIWISTWLLRTSFTFKSCCYVAICGFYVPCSSQKHLLGELYVSPLLYSRVLFLWLAIWRRIIEFQWKTLSWTSDYSFAREALRNHEQRFGKWKTFIGDFPSFVRLFLESSNLFCME